MAIQRGVFGQSAATKIWRHEKLTLRKLTLSADLVIEIGDFPLIEHCGHMNTKRKSANAELTSEVGQATLSFTTGRSAEPLRR